MIYKAASWGFSVKAGRASSAEPLASWIKPREFHEEILERPSVGYSLSTAGRSHDSLTV
jgi:hypothetical protein